ncbi:hypothetical protein ALC57_07544 [Trachymyrmex cornetzi]|uniref:HTH psq-type domain-containing protein n=1 Tax=Trachymyrmex cornetzi TaxID=471704 RepID=A0A151J7X6_9HYME|nr:hypothetical protein ALC57_07544 [Trachymyrmex cornetzi]
MSSSKKNKGKRKYCRFSYSKETLQDAINSARVDGMSINKASQQYKISKGTHFNKIHENVSIIERKMGPSPVLPVRKKTIRTPIVTNGMPIITIRMLIVTIERQ